MGVYRPFQPKSDRPRPAIVLFYRMGQVLTSDEADEFMKEADLNGDGKLDYDEFVKMMLAV